MWNYLFTSHISTQNIWFDILKKQKATSFEITYLENAY